MKLFAGILSLLASTHHRSTARRAPRPAVHPKSRHRVARSRSTRLVAVGAALLLPVTMGFPTVVANAAPVGQGFNLNASDLRFILKQIKIAERHADTLTPSNPCGTQLGLGADQIPNIAQGVELPMGLRTVDGSCNNLVADDQNGFGSADKRFPRLADRNFRAGEPGDPDGPGPAPTAPTSYTQNDGVVFDSQPRTISNLIVDQTPGNPAAVASAGETPVTTPSGAFFIPNVATDVGLSAPYNSWFTLFGQFFDHGLDLVNKGGNGSVFVPLKTDDPLFSTAPNAPNFMILTRATHDAPGSHEATNQTSPFVDQSQTYTSHPSHQVFLRGYTTVAGRPVATGRLITGPGGGMADWTAVKAQAASQLGIALTDQDALSIPLLATDPYGRFLRGSNGFPQLVVPSAPGGLVQGNPASPVPTTGSTKTGHAFLDDIAHHAAPGTFDHDNNPNTARVPQTPDADPGTSDDGIAGTYDDEMLGAHFIAGDGRVNENIGLTTAHHIFHSEHNRLTGVIDDMITNDPALTAAERADWHATNRPAGYDYGERIFQAARFVTEMEYQHLAFEEFIRKVQPMVNPFGEGGTGYNTTINPAIPAEFAHAVYRFGHSMLTESVDRVRPNGTRDDIPLLDAFLNPPEFMDGGLTPDQAAGNVVRGMTRQVGNELDEFVTEALRNRLLGLPLDLPVLNMARARDTGIPTLNAARRAFHAQTNSSALTPYESWADFGFSLKHRESLANFVAAYGTHTSVTGATTLVAKRNAGNAIVYGAAGADGELADNTATPADETADNPTGPIPADREDFLNSLNAYANNANGVTTTGVDSIDLWMGGLAEKAMVFGGLLGSTFNFVFEQTMENLQNGDRFYYLSRTAGLNMLTQLEGNSFAELIQRNTDVEGLPADSFARPDLIFNVANLGTSGPVPDDPATAEYDESQELTRRPDGTIRYAGPAHVVFNGTAGNDRVWSSEGDDTIRGNDGNDWMEGGDGADNLIGGVGDDILTDLFGDDSLKGGDGNDAMSSGQGFGGDLNQGGRGKDFIVGGNDMTEHFGGPDDDFLFAGDGDDTVFGDDGDDWMEGGKGSFNLLQGDNGAPFQDDPNAPGHDVLDGDGGEQDFDAEGGDDVMLMGPGIQRAEGMLGFDWSTHKGDPQPADSDMEFTVAALPTIDTNRDRFDRVEALSGWDRNDILRGDTPLPDVVAGDNVLNAAGIARVDGLQAFLGAGVTSFSAGNILLGGAGNDVIEGRGGDDNIDGDRWLNVQLRAPDLLTANTTDFTLVDGMGVDPDGAGPRQSLRTDVLAGRINPGQISIVRSIQTSATANVDTAVFSDIQDNYTCAVGNAPAVACTQASTGAITTVSHLEDGVVGVPGVDGTDTIRNIERLQFSDSVAPATPIIGTAVAGNGSATVNWTPGAGSATSFSVRVFNANTNVQIGGLRPAAADATSLTITGLVNGTAVNFDVQATNAIGSSAFSGRSNTVTPAVPATVPGAPTIGTATAGNASATVSWTPPASNGGSPITGYSVRVLNAANAQVGALRPAPAGAATGARSLLVTGLTNGTPVHFTVTATNGVGTGPASGSSNTVIPVAPAAAPGAPTIGTATAGNASATVNWTAPASNGSPITGYSVRVLNAANAQVGALRPAPAGAATGPHSLVVTGLANGTPVHFTVTATNGVGTGPASGSSNTVTPATSPGAPVIGAATTAQVANTPAGNGTAIARWTAPANGGSAITGYSVRVANAANVQVGALRAAAAGATSLTVSGLAGGVAVRFQVRATNAVTTGAFSAFSNAVTPTTVPNAPVIAPANPGAVGGAITATANWTPPTSNGGLALNAYQVHALRVNAAGGAIIAQVNSPLLVTTARSFTMTLPAGNYQFVVRARNALGFSAVSTRSQLVTAR